MRHKVGGREGGREGGKRRKEVGLKRTEGGRDVEGEKCESRKEARRKRVGEEEVGRKGEMEEDGIKEGNERRKSLGSRKKVEKEQRQGEKEEWSNGGI